MSPAEARTGARQGTCSRCGQAGVVLRTDPRCEVCRRRYEIVAACRGCGRGIVIYGRCYTCARGPGTGDARVAGPRIRPWWWGGPAPVYGAGRRRVDARETSPGAPA